MIPRATYRFQFHKGFGFADAEALVPYLCGLGISHVYASPITTARAGSTHGYDVVDPTRVNPELGGEDALRRLVAALRTADMGLVIDIVPNHMGVAGGGNRWWQDVLQKGEASEWARFFDINWRERLILPVLGTSLTQALDDRAIAIAGRPGAWEVVAYGEHRFPIRGEDQDAIAGATDDPEQVRAVLDRQHYRLASWRTADDDLNWRRFFTINELAGVRIEDPAVFEAMHALVFRLYGAGLIDGVRVDHVDGLTDPVGYCRALRARLDSIGRPADVPAGPAYIVIEKILGADETLSTEWGVDGTSGYDFMEEVSALLHDPAGEAAMTELWTTTSGRPADFADEERTARREMLAWSFEGQLSRTVEAFATLARSAPETEALTAGMFRRAIQRLLQVFPVYRTYGTGDAAPASDAAVRETVRERVRPTMPPGEMPVAEAVLAWLAGQGPGDGALARDAVRRFQQLCAPITAKAVEDTAFYRYGRLLSRNDVGFDPARFAMPVADFQARMVERARTFPHAMLTAATHDHKRGEDVRARLAVLSGIPDLWRETVLRWDGFAAASGVAPDDRCMLFQTLFGAWPVALTGDDSDALAAFAERVTDATRKALREAKLRSSWNAPDEAYEARMDALIVRLLDPARSAPFLADITGFVGRTADAALTNSFVQLVLRNTVPGMPDLYQGCELLDLSLVDPDNRRPVDYARRQALLADGGGGPDAGKLRVLREMLALRAAAPDLLRDGDYRPAAVSGPRAAHVLAFRRRAGDCTLGVAVLLRAASVLVESGTRVPSADWWQGTTVAGMGEAATLFADAPYAIRLDG